MAYLARKDKEKEKGWEEERGKKRTRVHAEPLGRR